MLTYRKDVIALVRVLWHLGLTLKRPGRMLSGAPTVRPPAERPSMANRSSLVYPSCRRSDAAHDATIESSCISFSCT